MAPWTESMARDGPVIHRNGMIKWWPFIHDPTAQVELDELWWRYGITGELTMADGEAAHRRTSGGRSRLPRSKPKLLG